MYKLLVDLYLLGSECGGNYNSLQSCISMRKFQSIGALKWSTTVVSVGLSIIKVVWVCF